MIGLEELKLIAADSVELNAVALVVHVQDLNCEL